MEYQKLVEHLRKTEEAEESLKNWKEKVKEELIAEHSPVQIDDAIRIWKDGREVSRGKVTFVDFRKIRMAGGKVDWGFTFRIQPYVKGMIRPNKRFKLPKGYNTLEYRVEVVEKTYA